VGLGIEPYTTRSKDVLISNGTAVMCRLPIATEGYGPSVEAYCSSVHLLHIWCTQPLTDIDPIVHTCMFYFFKRFH
jgi:hypothetical protein